MDKWVIDINCDVGEGIGNEALLFPYISSCNIACGGHAGDEASMTGVVRLALKHHLKIGAHPSYPDREHFGRVSMKMPKVEFQACIQRQVEALEGILRREKAEMHHLKPHGALYNDLMGDQELTRYFLESILHLRDLCVLYVPFGSVYAVEASTRGFDIQYEAFADRRYQLGYRLASRHLEGAVIEDPGEVFEQLVRMVKKQQVQTIEGTMLPLSAQTYCIHGDTRSALQILMYLANELPKQGIYLKK